MPDLERQVRRAIRWYPKHWRDQHEDALVAVLLDQAEAEGRSLLTTRVRADLVVHGFRLSFTPARIATGTIVALVVAAVLVWPIGMGPCHMQADGTEICNGTQYSAARIYLPNYPGGTMLAAAILTFIALVGLVTIAISKRRAQASRR